MSHRYNTAEGGSHGTNVSVANSGGPSGDAITTLVINNASTPAGSSSIIYSTAAAVTGSLGIRCVQASITANTYLYWSDTPATRYVVRRTIKPPTTPSALLPVMTVATGATIKAGTRLDTSGRIESFTGSATGVTASRYTLPSLNAIYIIEVAYLVGGSTSTGRIIQRVYAADGTTLLSEWDSGATLDIGTANLDGVRIMLGTASGTGWTYNDVDDIQLGALASGWWGPIVIPNLPPVANAALPKLTGTLAGTQTSHGSLIAATPKTTGALVGASLNTGTLAAVTLAAVASIQGESFNFASLSASTLLPISDIGGISVNTGIAAGAVPVLSGELVGSATNTGTLAGHTLLVVGNLTDSGFVNTGTLNASILSLVASIEAESQNSGTLSGLTPLVKGLVTDQAYIAGTLAATLPKLLGAVGGVPVNTGSFVALLPAVLGSIDGVSLNQGAVNATVARLLSSVSGDATNEGALTADLPLVVGLLRPQVLYKDVVLVVKGVRRSVLTARDTRAVIMVVDTRTILEAKERP